MQIGSQRETQLEDVLSVIARDVQRLRSDVAFFSRVVQQWRDIAIKAHIARDPERLGG